jgi:type III restriction enzyme
LRGALIWHSLSTRISIFIKYFYSVIKSDPFKILPPNERWAPDPKQMEMVKNEYEKLLPPLVYKIRQKVAEWRDNDYAGASETSKSLLLFWFEGEHSNGFRFFFSQRESIESIIYLYEVARAHDKFDMMRFDSSERVSASMFEETWPRYLVKMATGAGKTKVMGLTLVWSYFHKLYETDSKLSKNFLVIAPNIIVLNRLRKDFDGLKMFFEEPFLPDNGWMDRDWQNDFQLTLHIQDELKPITESGNIFLTNIHRVFFNELPEQTIETTFLGQKPKPDADTSKGLDLGKVLRSNKIQDLVALNDEAHHIHDKSLAWFKSLEDISNRLKLKNGNGLSLQSDYTATPRHNNGAIFVQTVADFPLVEAIRYNVVKSPVLPDLESRKKIKDKDSSDFIEKYRDFIHLGYLEWEKQYEELKSLKTPILFIMAMSTKEADEAAAFLELQYPLMKGKVLTIHTNKSGDIKEGGATKKDKEALDKLRKAADDIDKDHSPYRAVVSVLMLREGWDVRNVTTIVGLRPYKSDAKILPEQTIGRGLRKMFALDVPEKLVVVGTEHFLAFVETLKTEGVEFQYSPMGGNTRTKSPLIIEVDTTDPYKDLDALDIPLAILSPRIFREYQNLERIDTSTFKFAPLTLNNYPPEALKEIVFKDIDDEFSHTTIFRDHLPDYRNVIGFFAKNILADSRLVSGFEVLYPKVEHFITERLFGEIVDIGSPRVIKNLSEALTKHTIFDLFKKAINELTVLENGETTVRGYLSLKGAKSKIVENQAYLISKKCIFNKVVGDNGFELDMAAALDRMPDIVAFAKNIMGMGGVNFHIEYQKENGNLAYYYPDFFIKTDPTTIYILETKGREDLDDVRKIQRLTTWCSDVNAAQKKFTYKAVYVKQEDWDKKRGDLKTFADICAVFGKA